MDPESIPEGGQEPVKRPDVEARKKEVARIAADIEEVKRQMQAERELYPSAEEIEAADPASMAEWDTMSREEQMEWIGNMRRFVEKHRDDLAEVPGVEKMLDRLERISEHQEALIRLEEEAEEIALQSHADEADATTRLIVAMADIMKAMEKFTDDDWQDIPPENRAGMVDLLNKWNNGQREACLAQLPIEIRRQYE